MTTVSERPRRLRRTRGNILTCSIRFNAHEDALLEQICETENISRAEAIRRGLKALAAKGGSRARE